MHWVIYFRVVESPLNDGVYERADEADETGAAQLDGMTDTSDAHEPGENAAADQLRVDLL